MQKVRISSEAQQAVSGGVIYYKKDEKNGLFKVYILEDKFSYYAEPRKTYIAGLKALKIFSAFPDLYNNMEISVNDKLRAELLAKNCGTSFIFCKTDEEMQQFSMNMRLFR